MKVIYVAVLCFTLASYVAANNIIMGERESGDELIENKVINKAGDPWLPSFQLIGIDAPGGITKVSVSNVSGSQAAIKLLTGYIGGKKMVFLASTLMGAGMSIKVEAYGFSGSKNIPETQP